MNQFSIHNQDDAPKNSQPILKKVNDTFGMLPNLTRVLAESPVTLEAYVTLMGLFDKSTFSPAEQQIVMMTNNRLNACAYCMAANSTISLIQGVPEDVVETLRKGEAFADPKLEALRAFTAEVNVRRGFVTDEVVNAFLKAGYTKENVLEVILGTTMKTLANYTNHIAKTPIDEAFKAQGWSAEDNQ